MPAPIFSTLKVWIDNTRWAGNVELHVRSSEWHAHGHSDDPAYDNVALHVVLDEDRPVVRQNGERIPCLELKGRIPEHLTLDLATTGTRTPTDSMRRFLFENTAYHSV